MKEVATNEMDPMHEDIHVEPRERGVEESKEGRRSIRPSIQYSTKPCRVLGGRVCSNDKRRHQMKALENQLWEAVKNLTQLALCNSTLSHSNPMLLRVA